ncbi:hypothetical protein PABG_12479 [Paracoccidioides brasiliensis Pb03]|uniref:Uncharacterized protein n=1 Tax=Paracoccidioides brasiliensis TaxID=121759 RepID=A0A1D2JCE1_PARBR|nr:hypothetical protein PABG_12479 [Paracoccidioides brasiliensis Pb03]ODH26171.1 hypothetical protein ACO22_04761 [Paracoccidioides brasiliensis]
MKITIVASLLLTIAGLAAASPLAQPDDVPIVAVEPDNGPSITSKPGASCSASGRVTCSFSDGQRPLAPPAHRAVMTVRKTGLGVSAIEASMV